MSPGASATHRTIVEAIQSKRRLRFTYNGTPRLSIGPVEDRALVDARGNVTAAGPNYKRNDSAMVTIFAKL